MRIILILLFFSLASIHVQAQESDTRLVNRHHQASDSLAELSDYKNAILYRKKALNILQNQRPVKFDQLVRCYRTIGFYYRKWGKFKESLHHQKRAVEIAEKRLDSTHLELAKAYNGFGSYFYSQGIYDRSYTFFNKALQISLLAGYPTIGDYYNNVGIAQQHLGNDSSSLETYQKALDYNSARYGFYHQNTANNYENIATLYYNFGQYGTALNFLDTVELILDSLHQPGSPYFASVYNNFGAVLTSKGDYKRAIHYLDEGLRIYEKYLGGEHPDVANVYANTGLLLLDRGDLDKALAYFKKSMSIRESNFGKKNPLVARTMIYLGNCFLQKGNFEEAFEYINNGLKIYLNLSGVDPSEIADARNELGYYYEKIFNYKEALKQYNLALDINKNKLGRYDPDVANSYARIGQVHLAQKDFEDAASYFDNALLIREKTYGKHHADVADAYRLLALTCPDDESCIKWHLDRAFAAIHYTNDAAEPFEKVLSPIVLLKTYLAQGKLDLGFYERTENVAYLYRADSVFAQAIELINFIKTSLEQPGSRLALQDNYYQVYEDAILVKYKLQEHTKDQTFWHQSFDIAEQSNAILLLEAMQTVDAERFTNIPDSLVQKERELKIDLAYLEKLRFEEELKNGSSNRKVLKDINDRIFNLHEEQHKLLTFFRKNHPQYFNLKYNPKTVSVDRIQKKLLREDQTMLAYFVGEDHLFAFIISKETFDVVQIDKDFPLEIWVEDFRSSIYQFSPLKKDLDYLNQKFTNIGHELYQLLIQPVIDKLNTNSLVIVPGGTLGYLPFDALLVSQPMHYGDFDSHDYLIKHFQISYTYSATLLEEMSQGNHKRRPLIAFAPSYFGDTLNVTRSNDPWRAVLGKLRFNVQEATAIHDMMGGELYLDSMANEATFMERAPHAGILHLATHGKANDRHGEYSYLAFYQFPDSIENELLFVKNLYNMHIPASLVVLSACETGIGELQRGEGIVSLARGFSFAGAASIITTLWSIDDNASANIMVDFYKNLNDGQNKDEALRNAKLDYIELNRGNNRTHPLYWAAFVPVGNMQPISGGVPVWGWILIAGAALAGLYWYLDRYL